MTDEEKEVLVEARKALEPFVQVARIFKGREAQHGDTIHSWEFTSGTAQFTISQCRDAERVAADIDRLMENH